MRIGSAARKGVWTPVLTFVAPGDLAVAYAANGQLGEWYLENGVLRAFFTVVASTFTHTTAAGALRISGLPYVAKTRAGMIWSGSLSRMQGVTKVGYTHFATNVVSAASDIQVIGNGSAVALSPLSTADLPTGTAKTFIGAVTYPVA